MKRRTLLVVLALQTTAVSALEREVSIKGEEQPQVVVAAILRVARS